ncbi:phosphotransferase [Dietzia cinnamea]|uniref:Maltokinase n=1 Tax=Dietzia cinnamea TaxID=321318 RepID=A0ABV3YHX9_9ACTN|nr:phosphotransferase [Dietzia cinnamea]MCT2173011.1 phosphotransferase [Dietzia cinnamea]
MSIAPVDDDALARLLTDWLPEQRWFAGKGLELSGVRVARRAVMLDDPEVLVEHLLVDLEVDGRPQRYQVPIATAPELPGDRRAFPLTPEGASPVVYDGLRDPRGTESLLQHLGEQAEVGGLRFRLVADAPVPEPTWGRLLEGEQSNSSLVFGDDLMVKVFRLVQPGVNPDVELHAALADRDCPAVAALRGWVELSGDGDDGEGGDTGNGPTTLAMAQEFMAGAADGWAMATASVRDLFAEADLLAEEVGTDFADEAGRLGAAVAQVHEDLAAATGVTTRDGTDLVASMRARLDAAVAEVPALAEFADAARAVFDEVAGSGPVRVHRIHGDLHLGQTLRAPDRWIVIDFEGEPAAPLAERRVPDSPARDVAGILRSLDYAAQHTLVGVEDRQLRFRAREWRDRNVDAFCSGYAEVSDADPRDSGALLRAYTLDKALYEVVYESRNRPGWVPVPMGAVERILAAG